MLDIKAIRDNASSVKGLLASRQKDYSGEVDQALSLDLMRRELIASAEALKAQQNSDSKQIPALKKSGRDTAPLFLRLKETSDKIRRLDEQIRETDARLGAVLLELPNIPGPEVPAGKDAADNLEVRRWGEPVKFGFEARPHWEIGERLGILDPTGAAKVTGARFHFYKGSGARLERAVINFFLDCHTAAGYVELLPPYIVNRASMTGTGQLPKFEEDAFKLAGEDYFLIPTAEVPVTNLHRDEIIDADALPISYCAYSACFRAEAGSAGRDTRGLIRQHQFNKVELVKFTTPETSYRQLEELTLQAESVLQKLGLSYRVMRLCSGDMGFSSAMTYDIEVYMPSYGRYVEISSCSNFEDFQARRAAIRYRPEPGAKPAFLHTLNGSGVAVGRTVACILETFQNEDGTVDIPEALKSYMGGAEKIERR